MQDLGSVQYLDFPGSNQFPRRFESEDHARPWFCLVPRFYLEATSFSIGLSPRNMQDFDSAQYLDFPRSNQFPHRLESEDHAKPWFCLVLSFFLEVISFLIGLSPRTIQDLGQFEPENHARPWFCLVLSFFLEVASFPIGLSPRTMQDLGSVQHLVFSWKQLVFPQV